MLAEDDPLLRQLITEQLKRGGFNVLAATDGREGMELYERNRDRIDIILSDLQMPGASGVEFAEYNASNAFFPFVVYSSVYEAAITDALIRCGVYDYLLKPVELEVLIGTLRHALLRAKLKAVSTCRTDPDLRGHIVVKSTMEELSKANNWIFGKICQLLSVNEARLFAYHLSELVLNAYEHGNLGLNEKLKSALIVNGQYEKEIKIREGQCAKAITIEISAMDGSVAAIVSDEGCGFDYERYLNMTEGAIIDRLSLPNGRGILMCSRYFDAMNYHNGGSSVIVSKSIRGNRHTGE